MRKWFIGFLSLSLLFVPTQILNATAAKAGANCSKLGLSQIVNGYKFTCIKSGTKFVWNKGSKLITTGLSSTSLATTAASPTNSSNPTVSSGSTPILTNNSDLSKNFIPWSSDVTIKSVSDAAQLSYLNWLKIQNNKSSRHYIYVENEDFKNRSKLLQIADKLVSDSFDSFLPFNTYTVIGTSKNWIIAKMQSLGADITNCSEASLEGNNIGVDYCTALGTNFKDHFLGMQIFSDVTYDSKNPGRDGAALLSHEFFHFVQVGLTYPESMLIKSGLPESENVFPVWLVEGSANFVGFSSAAHALGATYWDGKASMFQYAPQEEWTNGNALRDYEIRNGPGNYSPTYPYVVGQSAVEYLVASIGFENLLRLFSDYRNTKNFEVSFQKITGLSKDNFYQKFELLRQKLGLPEVSWKLVCLKNMKISEAVNANQACMYSSTSGAISGTNQSQSNSKENLLEKPCQKLGEETTTFYLWVCTNVKEKGLIWIRKGTENQYEIIKN